jgi:hypothetical protein
MKQSVFVANEEGQRIFWKRGLVPDTQPIRLKPVEVTSGRVVPCAGQWGRSCLS